jgi:hypothetical protein
MKILFFYIGTPSPVFETELELIHKHEKAGDIVKVIQCGGNLPNCHWNLKHVNSQCSVCNSKFQNGWDALKLGANVELKQFQANPNIDAKVPAEFDSVDEIQKYQHDNENIGFGVTASLISIFRDHRFDTKKHSSDIHRTLSTSLHVYETLKHEINQLSPDLVYFFNGRIATHLPAKLLCKKLGIDYSSYEVSVKENCYRLLKNKVVHDVLSIEEVDQLHSNWTFQNRDAAESVLKKMRAGKAAINYTQDQRQGALPEGFDLNKKNIAIFNGTIDEYAGIENAKNKIYKPDETAGVYKILESFESDSHFFFYLRVHPHMKEVASTTSQLVDIRELSLRFSNVRVIWPGEEVDSYALMDACEKVITFGSSVGIEATYWGKPSILADHAAYERLNYAYLPNNHNELVALLKQDLEPLSTEAAFKSIFLMTNDGGILRESFKEKKINNQSVMVTADGNKVQASALTRLWQWLHIFPFRLGRVIKQPKLILKKLKM